VVGVSVTGTGGAADKAQPGPSDEAGRDSSRDSEPASVYSRLLLARAVMKPGERARYITDDNLLSGYDSVERAVESGLAFAVPMRSDVLLLDADAEKYPESPAGVEKVAAELWQEGILPVVCHSGRPGNLHLFARVEDPALYQRLEALAEDYGVDVRRGNKVIRPPLTPHRTIGFSALRQPVKVDMAVRALRPRLRRELPAGIMQTLQTGKSGNASNSDRLQSQMDSMYQCDWPFDEALSRLWIEPGGATLHRIEQEGRDVRKFALDTWWKAIQWVQKNPPVGDSKEVVVALVELRHLALDQAWRRSTGATDRAVLLALLHIGITHGTYVVGSSLRSLALLAGRSQHGTIGKSVGRLIDLGWLRRETLGEPGRGSTYRLTRPKNLSNTPLLTSPIDRGGVRSSGVFTRHDAFGYGGGLGFGAALVYEALSMTAQTASEIAEIAGAPKSSVHRNLGKLELRGLAVKQLKTWVRGPVGPDEVATRRGSAGAGQNVKERFAAERLAYRGSEAKPDGGLRLVVKAGRREPTRCIGVTSRGRPCNAMAVRDKNRCVRHRDQADPLPPAESAGSSEPWADHLEAELAAEWEAEVWHEYADAAGSYSWP
jgi:hypothetical protein